MSEKFTDSRKILFILDEIRQVENRLQNLRQEVLTLLPPEKKHRKGSIIKKFIINGKERFLKY